MSRTQQKQTENMSVHNFPQFHPRGSSPVTVTWHCLLEAAESEQEVVDIARDFLATLSPYDIARLPANCRPGKMVDASDITTYAFLVMRHHCDEGHGMPRVAHKLAAFFSGASIRLSQILAASGGEDDIRHSA